MVALRKMLCFIALSVGIVGGAVACSENGGVSPTSSPREDNPASRSAENGASAHAANFAQGEVEVFLADLEIPWEIAFLPEGGYLVTERPGRLVMIDGAGNRKVIEVSGVRHRGEGGLMGMVLHPNFSSNRLIYLYMTAAAQNGSANRVERYRFEDGALTGRTTIIEGIPGARYHDGGRLEFGPDGKLYITTGDATVPKLAQNTSSLAGKILRLNDDGSVPPHNPFGNEVYSYGHRNPQGLAWDDAGRLWSTEHGRSGFFSGMDEINLIRSGANYGWPESEGDKVLSGTVGPALHSGSEVTWAPAGAAHHDGSLFFGGLRGQTLYEAVLNGDEVSSLKKHFDGVYGRIRTVRVGPDGYLYFMTSNMDGRGSPRPNDDKILRIKL